MKSENRSPKSDGEPVEVLEVLKDVPPPSPGPKFSEHVEQLLTAVDKFSEHVEQFLTAVEENLSLPAVLKDSSDSPNEEMRGEPYVKVVATFSDDKEETTSDFGPFLDYYQAQRCVANLAGNPKVVQARIVALDKPKRLTKEKIRRLFGVPPGATVRGYRGDGDDPGEPPQGGSVVDPPESTVESDDD
jgi:hypothetical protein